MLVLFMFYYNVYRADLYEKYKKSQIGKNNAFTAGAKFAFGKQTEIKKDIQYNDNVNIFTKFSIIQSSKG